jgi:hypothetical protein
VSGRRALLLVFIVTLPFVTPKVRGADEIEYFAYLRSLVFDHDLEFGNEYQHFYDQDPQGLAGFAATFLEQRESVTGRHINFAPIGSALLWSPFYLAAHAGVLLARGLGAEVAADGYALPYVAAACFASALYGFLGLLLLHDALSRHGGVSEPAATWTVAALWLGSPVLYYMTVAPAFSHASSLFAVSLLLWLWLRARGEGGALAWARVGLAGGLAALVREQDALFLAVPVADLAWTTLRERTWKRGALGLGLMGVAAAGVFAPQLLAYHALNGSYAPSKLVARKLTFTSPHFFEVLFDPAHGLFLWSPLLLLAVGGLAVAVVRRRDVPTLLLSLALVLQVWINGSVESWTQAGAFGSRRFVSATPVFAWGLAALIGLGLPRIGSLTTAALLAVTVWWNVSLMVQFGLKLMDRQGLEWPRVAVAQISEVPRRAGGALWLFFTDRERLAKEGR